MYLSHGPSNDMPYSTATVSVTNTTATTVASVAATASAAAKIVRVYALVLVPSAATSVTFQDSASSFTFGPLALAINQVFVLPNTGTPWFITAPGASFQIVNTAATLTGWIYYTQNQFGG